jgi:hypothetical protein
LGEISLRRFPCPNLVRMDCTEPNERHTSENSLIVTLRLSSTA